MGPRLAAWVVLSLCSVACSAGAWDLVDDRGRRISSESPAERIVSLAPNITELLYHIGAGDRIVGAVAFSDHPEAARSLPRVGDAFRVDLERLAALAPDLVVAWGQGNPDQLIDDLASRGYRVLVLTPNRLEDIARHMEMLGTVTGLDRGAAAASRRFRGGLEELGTPEGGARSVGVFYQISEQPLYTVGGRHIVSDIIGRCGGENIFGDLDAPAPTVDREAVLARGPEVIIAASSPALSPDWRDVWRRWPGVPAVGAGNLFTVDADLVSRPSHRMLEGARRICAMIDRAR